MGAVAQMLSNILYYKRFFPYVKGRAGRGNLRFKRVRYEVGTVLVMFEFRDGSLIVIVEEVRFRYYTFNMIAGIDENGKGGKNAATRVRTCVEFR